MPIYFSGIHSSKKHYQLPPAITHTPEQSWGSFRKQTLRRSWNLDFSKLEIIIFSHSVLFHGFACFSTQRLNNGCNYISREPDKTIRNKLTITDISWKEWQLFTYINERRIAKNELLLLENLSALFKLEYLVCCKEIR